MRRTECFFGNKSRFETSSIDLNSSKRCELNSFIAGKPSLNPSKTRDMNHLFKVPTFENLPVRKTNIKSVVSPIKRVQSGRNKNELKLSQQSKVNFRPSSSFLNANRKSHHSSVRNNQLKKELIKKMVYLAECALQNNQEIKNSTPVKPVPKLTPRRVPRVREYLVLPEFNKKAPNIDEMRSPLKQFIKQEPMICSSVKKTPLTASKTLNFIEKREILNDSFSSEMTGVKSTICDATYITTPVAPQSPVTPPYIAPVNDKPVTISRRVADDTKNVIVQFQNYNAQVSELMKQLQSLESCFQNTMRELPENMISKEFDVYLSKKHDLNDKIKVLENDLKDAIKNNVNIQEKLESFMNENRQLFETQVKLHNDFECLVETVATKCATNKISDDANSKIKELSSDKVVLVNEEKPKLRRSLRLSKLPRKEVTPMQKKLSRLNTMSKVIQKPKKSPCCRRGKVLQM